jgi:hypothetical protein
MDYKNSDRLLFICASAGNGGHRLGRIVSCAENVYWYSHANNGIHPWDAERNNIIKGKDISQYHYDRLLPLGVVPLVGERVEKYWSEDDVDYYYSVVWPKLMQSVNADQILEHHFLTWVVHDAPKNIRSRFPNSKIINLIDDDVDSVALRYFQTTSLFPAKIENTDIKPSSYLSNFSKLIKDVETKNLKPSIRDLWCFQKHNEFFYNPIYDQEYLTDIKLELADLDAKKNSPVSNSLSLTWARLDIRSIESYLNSKLNENFKHLI